MSKAADMVKNNSFDDLVGKSPEDPLYKAVFDKLLITSAIYKNKAGADDTITGVPKEGSWIKYNGPDGKPILLRVTYNGHLDTSGFSNRAYAEFQDTEGNMYSMNGSATLGRGVDRKYNRV